MRRVGRTLFLVFLLLGACMQPVDYKFELISSSTTGIDFVNKLTSTPELNILTYLYYYNGGGVAAADFNGDQFIDLYFTCNQCADRLYLNKGDFKFKDVTVAAGISNADGWTTGVTYVDVNNDGLQDIYVSKVGAYRSIIGRNLLYVNQGIDAQGVPKFLEQAELYNLDLLGFSTQAAFFDYDLDGDLDLFQLNHSVHPNRAYGKGNKRNAYDPLAGDRLLRNDNGLFVDVSEVSGIYRGEIGYGLDMSIGDINNDGYPDLYVGNDFFENDYLYLNQGDGTFEDIISSDESRLGHTSHYSMGNAVEDLNNDGYLDIVSLDMLPEDIVTYKSSGSEDPFPTYSYYMKNGYAPQYMQNTLHMNLGEGSFSEIANYSGVSASEWSWSALAADFDMDGYKDLYISNGIKGATNDMDFIAFIAQTHIQKQIDAGLDEEGMEFISKIPSKKLVNYSYRNQGNTSFENTSSNWMYGLPSYSNGAVYADLDNDGDLDLVVNNIDDEAFIYRNNGAFEKSNFLKLAFEGPDQNKFGIGARVEISANDLHIVEENFPNKSYLSSVPPDLTIGLGKEDKLDSLIVIWPGGAFEKLIDVGVNQTLTISYENASGHYSYSIKSDVTFVKNDSINLDFVHYEEKTLEFERDPLIPYAKGNEGPSISVVDINEDGLDDIFIGGAKRQSSRLMLQKDDGSFENFQNEVFESDKISEDVDQVFFDADGDGDKDIVIVSGGNEFVRSNALAPKLFVNKNGSLIKSDNPFDVDNLNLSSVKSFDIDNDGDQDLVMGCNTVAWEYGKSGTNLVFINDGKGNFEKGGDEYGSFSNVGLIEDLAIIDIDRNGFDDIIAAGHWMPITIFLNNGKGLKKISIKDTEGWWNTVAANDFDNDGDIDLIVGNWGLNTRLKASTEKPIMLYRNDFDENGKVDPIVTYFFGDTETTLATKDELAKSLPYLNKRFLSYTSFAKASLVDLFGAQNLDQAVKKRVVELASCYFENIGNLKFTKKLLPMKAQISSVHDIEVADFDSDGYEDILLVGNNYEINTQLGRQDASHGTILLNDENGFFMEIEAQGFDIPGPARDIESITIAGKKGFLVGINNGKPIFLKWNNQ